jgi:hypothetical protein
LNAAVVAGLLEAMEAERQDTRIGVDGDEAGSCVADGRMKSVRGMPELPGGFGV